jgi:hypothetical protein
MQTLWLKGNKEHKRTSRYSGVSWDAKCVVREAERERQAI